MNKAPIPCEIEFDSSLWEGDDCFKVTFVANDFHYFDSVKVHQDA